MKVNSEVFRAYDIRGIVNKELTSKLVENIHLRGREFENSISIDYLSRLNERYEAWVQNYDKGKIISIDVDKVNFVGDPKAFGSVINLIDKEINGLF